MDKNKNWLFLQYLQYVNINIHQKGFSLFLNFFFQKYDMWEMIRAAHSLTTICNLYVMYYLFSVCLSLPLSLILNNWLLQFTCRLNCLNKLLFLSISTFYIMLLSIYLLLLVCVYLIISAIFWGNYLLFIWKKVLTIN
jgi:hypothetical protein